MKTNENTVTITADGSMETLNDVADIAEVAPGRLMIATLDGSRDMTGGTIFGSFGEWKMWHEADTGDVIQYLAETPLTMPGDVTKFRYRDNERWYDAQRSGRIKRLKRADL